ncbi:hypothetical protein BDP55DRAFT_591645 [Colletotrichum godetiae]|uniref:Uncharacterized protein n=1 Tax=Colletotrichum godetiae TaxID=1209918 RepID=A0AAJ0ESN7_9PEZI|nr:uncharacterized protein BDP55DRAFT_591645 [Colletotrichum godetiae]KAK1659688.1 hypothetical protein BDP55DRAFT_591645 [Colletotrichum godetiae]
MAPDNIVFFLLVLPPPSDSSLYLFTLPLPTLSSRCLVSQRKRLFVPHTRYLLDSTSTQLNFSLLNYRVPWLTSPYLTYPYFTQLLLCRTSLLCSAPTSPASRARQER